MATSETHQDITATILLNAYTCGIFPMAENANDPSLHWYEPKRRGILPLDGFHLSRSLAKIVRSDTFDVRIDQDFDAVIQGCATAAPGRESTWINSTIRRLYRELFYIGHCHTVETYKDGVLVGGLYGVSIGGVFFGESMFHTATDASKVALVHLVARMKRGGYQLLDAQFVTTHLARFGAIEIDKRLYQTLLGQSLDVVPAQDTWSSIMQSDDILTFARR